ncbi:nuclear transport factor 2 family protein [Octadecabacter sp. 1_MG-2023]|uniref:nuclear transport factor 2 family protein n=1 Tax=unclassified Octadecabacter TaxID=196158 RepID=UPI001C097B27|nr:MULTISPECIES: nuclear transport factor 2 family protein [unclassified Octadecabacter]MBU2991806.1 nuclear transport factor 2 family protein [Octadecabacter sp. B2R22]MDO6735779.1 nuclear transport factor 2 family protein [Octadecabacter sp. 1_MG-2023]
MSDALTTFFDAWGTEDADARLAMLKYACSSTVTYSDPRSGERLSGIQAVADYVGMFSANAPGWTAKVTSCDEVNGYSRAIVAFGGMGPDGTEMVQHGTYFCEAGADGKLTMLAGFVGVGAVE